MVQVNLQVVERIFHIAKAIFNLDFLTAWFGEVVIPLRQRRIAIYRHAVIFKAHLSEGRERKPLIFRFFPAHEVRESCCFVIAELHLRNLGWLKEYGAEVIRIEFVNLLHRRFFMILRLTDIHDAITPCLLGGDDFFLGDFMARATLIPKSRSSSQCDQRSSRE